MKEAHHITPRITQRRIHSHGSLASDFALLLLLACLCAGLAAADRPASTKPYIKVLGTAQDGGFPHASCFCERCELARRHSDRARLVSSLALVLPGSDQVYLFDATPDLRQQLVLLAGVKGKTEGGVERDPLAGIFLTHAHIGHYLGLAFFGYEAVHTRSLPVMATPRMAEFLRTNGPWSQLVSMKNIALVEMSPGEVRQLDEGVEVQAFQAPHRDEYADTLGFLITGPQTRILYLPDTDSWTAWTSPVTKLFERVDVALIDGTFFSPDELAGRSVEEIGHPLISDSMDLLQDLVDSNRLQVFFTHFNHSNPVLDADGEARRLIEQRGFHLLEQGQEITL